MNLFQTTDEQKVKVYEIDIKMKSEGLDSRFIVNAVKLAEIYEGAYDLFCLWDEEDIIEKGKNILDLKLKNIEHNLKSRHIKK